MLFDRMQAHTANIPLIDRNLSLDSLYDEKG